MSATTSSPASRASRTRTLGRGRAVGRGRVGVQVDPAAGHGLQRRGSPGAGRGRQASAGASREDQPPPSREVGAPIGRSSPACASARRSCSSTCSSSTSSAAGGHSTRPQPHAERLAGEGHPVVGAARAPQRGVVPGGLDLAVGRAVGDLARVERVGAGAAGAEPGAGLLGDEHQVGRSAERATGRTARRRCRARRCARRRRGPARSPSSRAAAAAGTTAAPGLAGQPARAARRSPAGARAAARPAPWRSQSHVLDISRGGRRAAPQRGQVAGVTVRRSVAASGATVTPRRSGSRDRRSRSDDARSTTRRAVRSSTTRRGRALDDALAGRPRRRCARRVRSKRPRRRAGRRARARRRRSARGSCPCGTRPAAVDRAVRVTRRSGYSCSSGRPGNSPPVVSA